MANEVIEMPMRNETSSNMPVTKDDVEVLKRQRELLKDFISSQLKEGIDNDYAIIPGTGKQSLLKPGAEKLARLFGLGIRVNLADKEIDRHANFAMFTYKAEIYLLKNPGVVIAECEASCNSQEKKYKERTVYVNGAKTKEETPICDILNTLQKMCQKRALVGAVVLAVGGSDFFTQDIDDLDDAEQNGINGKTPARASVIIPKATSAKSQDQSQGSMPQCCGRQMMISKFKANEIYCSVCKKTKAINIQPAPVVLPKTPEPTPQGDFGSFGAPIAPVMNRDELIKEINKLGGYLKMSTKELVGLAAELYKKTPPEMSDSELNAFIAHLHLGARGK